MIRALLGLLLLVACSSPTAGSEWQLDERGLAGYAIATGIAAGPDGTIYVSTYREGAVYVRRSGEPWSRDPALDRLAGYGVASARPETAIAATVDGVYRTEDAGRRWQRVTDQRAAYSVAFDRDGIAWAGLEGALLRSADDGKTWQETARLDPAITVLGISRSAAGLSLATAGGGIRLLREDGLHQSLPTRQVVSSIAADSAGRLVARIEGRVWRSDRGDAWEPVAEFSRPVLAVGAAAGALLAATEGTGVLRSEDGGWTWEPVGGALGAPVYAVGGGEQIVAATAHGVLIAGPTGWETTGDGFGRPLVRSLSSGGALLAATSDGIYRRDASGWSALSRDLRGVATLFVVAAGNELVAGTFEGGIVRSEDGGRRWETVTEREYRRAIIPALAVAGDRIVARVKYDRTLQSRDRGESWALTDAGLAGRTVFSLAADGDGFWAGTDAGVFRLTEALWEALPPLAGPASALLTTPGGLVAGTPDGLWRLENGAWRRDGLAGRQVIAILAGRDGQPEIVGTSVDGVFRRSNNRWQAIGPTGVRINALAIDPADGGLVVAAESGVWRRR